MDEQILIILERWIRNGRINSDRIKKPTYKAEVEKRLKPKKVK